MSPGIPASVSLRGASCLALFAVALILSACGSKPVRESGQPPAPLPADDVANVTLSDRTSTIADSEERIAREALERQGMVIHFDYDSSQLRPQYVDLIAAHARHAVRFASIMVRLEGHTDERGSREYNIALGERRAQAVKRALELQGIVASRITTVSYGEERPASSGSGEDSWSQNRRVEIRYLP
jgi:peptidoglycan-associated lipoprotein